MEGANTPHRIKEIRLGDSMRFPARDGTVKSLPEEGREASRPLVCFASAADATEQSIWDHDRGDTVPQSEDKAGWECCFLHVDDFKMAGKQSSLREMGLKLDPPEPLNEYFGGG